jgi:hypothetical protein
MNAKPKCFKHPYNSSVAPISVAQAIADSGRVTLYSAQTKSWMTVCVNNTFLEFDYGDDEEDSATPSRKRSASCSARISSESMCRVQRFSQVSASDIFEHSSSGSDHRNGWFGLHSKDSSTSSTTMDASPCFTTHTEESSSLAASPKESMYRSGWGEVQSEFTQSEFHQPEFHQSEFHQSECQTGTLEDLFDNRAALPFDKEPVRSCPRNGKQIKNEYLTLMIRGIPCSLTQQDMFNILDNSGLSGKYDFFYLPKAGASASNLGYAFVNFVDCESANACTMALQGKMLSERSTKVCQITPADIQGLPKLRSHFRRSTFRRASRPVFVETEPMEAQKSASSPVQKIVNL